VLPDRLDIGTDISIRIDGARPLAGLSISARTPARPPTEAGPYFTVPSSPLSHAWISTLRIGSGWPQSMQRILRPPVSLTSMSLIALWHIGQSDDWV
jgi:hypothetical protein